ncbi:MAG: methylated-DNA--[protein]-cysteine S-methyltransferase [Nitrospiraceae bacterium]
MNQSLTFKTPWGWMGITASTKGVHAGVCRIVLPQVSRRAVELELSRTFPHGPASLNGRPADGEARQENNARVLKEARAQLVAFFERKRRELDFPVDLSGGSAFQRRVWRAILAIPYGRVRSYKWVALRVGGTRYARAVGHALGANPVPIVIPCHRVVAHDASLGGFTGGLRTKRRLLQLEGTLPLLKS